jgi:signal transduction histidine kinase
MAFYTLTVVAITTSRVFNARQILMVAIQKICLVSVVAIAAYSVDYALSELLSGPVALLVTVSFSLWLSALVKDWLDGIFEFYPKGNVARLAVYAAAQRERQIDKLEAAFVSILAGWGQSERAVIMSGGKQSIVGNSIELSSESTELRTIRQLRWATPERLSRERPTEGRVALMRFLHEKQLGISVVEEGIALTVLLGVGVSASRRPFTYPQVTQLMELASVIESTLERAHFSAKIQHTEQLATVGLLGASLAHEIRNPLVSIKTFVQLLPSHYQDPAFREKFFRLIGDEVMRIDQLTDQLLDLAAPRAYSAQLVELHPVLKACVDLVAAKASHRGIDFVCDLQANPDQAFTDSSAAKQVVLNLCFNAIQAIDSASPAERWVRISTRNRERGIEMSVCDSGPGISPEIRPKLFQPFQTTKSSGFGLGLAICSDILTNLNASISVDAPAPGCGATFRVTFPCHQLSS